MDDIITIIIYIIILILGAIASSKKKKNLKPQQSSPEKTIPKPIEEILKELGVPIEEPKQIVIEETKDKKTIINEPEFETKTIEEKEPKSSFLNNKYESLETIENKIQSLESNNEELNNKTLTSYYIDDAYKAKTTYEIDYNRISKEEITSQIKEEIIQDEMISFMLKNPKSLIIYSDILKSKYF